MSQSTDTSRQNEGGPALGSREPEAERSPRERGRMVVDVTRELIAERFQEQGLDDVGVAVASGIPARRVQLLLSGKSPLRVSDLLAFAEALTTMPSELVREAERRVDASELLLSGSGAGTPVSPPERNLGAV